MCYIRGEFIMNKNSFVSVRIPKDVKDKAVALLDSFGYSLSAYINVLLKEMVDEGYPQLEAIKELRNQGPKSSVLSFEDIKAMVEAATTGEQHIVSVSLFGSYSRGEATKKSDIDLHVVSDGKMGLTELVAFENRLSKALGKKVDAVGSALNSPETDFIKMIKGKEVLLYERRA
jgi:predicted nucleotidyltransferase